ncbi:MAG: histidine kinase, partial [Gammaproteobacteria bacterium]|nr:histidine kinase [Gammaproteobacteria bacterium]
MQSPDRNANYHRAYLREKRARHQAEEILEKRSRELFEANVRIETQYANLEAAHDQLKEAQGQLVQSEKMASVGHLAAGIAHEINNPMAFVSSNLNTLGRTAERFARVLREYESFVASVRQMAPELFASSLTTLGHVLAKEDVRFLLGDMKEIVEDSREGADRVSEIVLGLRNFSRLDDDIPKTANINEGLRGTLKIAASEIRYQHVIKTDYGDIPDMLCFAGQLNQVFLNLIVNASQACSENGKIQIRTFVESDHVVVEIEDNGRGIDPKHQ